jgi:hypothetical protein
MDYISVGQKISGYSILLGLDLGCCSQGIKSPFIVTRILVSHNTAAFTFYADRLGKSISSQRQL